MPRTDFIEQLWRQLVKLGCPRKHARRLVQEVAGHREDLRQAALAEGLSEAKAESNANAQLGDPVALAERLIMALRQASWWSRRYLVAFCILPLVVFPVLWALLLWLNLSLGFALGYGWNYHKLHLAADNPVAFHHLVTALRCADYGATALVAILFCWLARRSAVSIKWMVAACAICSVYALFIQVGIKPHNMSVLLSWNPQWIRSVIPLLIAGAIYGYQRRETEISCQPS